MFAYLHHNHFSTYLRNYSGMSKLVIWSDDCGYQNISADIAHSVLHLSVGTINAPVEPKCLTLGHIQMNCGAMHSLVERKTKCNIFTPRKDVLAMAMAREAPFPFTVSRFITTSLRYCLKIFVYLIHSSLKEKGGLDCV
ncbi:hypothetical protein PoB_004876000 [Plakobranchus ocellatus]|uniref:Uncharacterized protein n=1 Tax=Plakobranchus ocellatus TaxID=259542 RepID=A0AAV4BNW7_9GAST|nr:hypothetical protein PoB_004876000 [Plakobranchus ocellatus]